MHTNTTHISNNTTDKCFYYRTYSFQADIGNCFPNNFVPQLKPKKNSNCNLSPLKLKDSSRFPLSKDRSDNDGEIRLFNIKKKNIKVVSLSNSSTSTDLPKIEFDISSSMFQHRRMTRCDLSIKSSLKQLIIKKKSLTILGGLKRIKSAGTVNL